MLLKNLNAIRDIQATEFLIIKGYLYNHFNQKLHMIERIALRR